MKHRPLPRAFYDRPVVDVARDLLGKQLLRASEEGPAGGLIVEVEAYLAVGDTACHACRGRNRRNATMFGPAGYAYVYAIHSRYCLNAVTEGPDVPSAVLIRAIRPREGIELMQERRNTDRPMDLARGPARLCEALDITRELDGCDLSRRGPLWISDGDSPVAAESVGISTRIGVTSAHNLRLRFFVRDCPFVSGPLRLRT